MINDFYSFQHNLYVFLLKLKNSRLVFNDRMFIENITSKLMAYFNRTKNYVFEIIMNTKDIDIIIFYYRTLNIKLRLRDSEIKKDIYEFAYLHDEKDS